MARRVSLRVRVLLGLIGVATVVFATRQLACAPLEPGRLREAPAALGGGADPERLEREVRFLAETIGPRGQRHPAAMRRAADHLATRFEAAGAAVSRQPTPVGSPAFENVVARFGEGEPTRIVGAHYDSWQDTAGADDNGSGVAGLLELARLLGAMSEPPAVELVGYANEEPPHFRTHEMGSVTHARRGGTAPVVVLEMIGFFSEEPGSQDYPSHSLSSRMPDVGDFIVVIGRSEDEALALAVRDAMSVHEGLPVYGYAAPITVPGVDSSDHRSYWPEDRSAVMVTDTAFLRNRAYHTPEDTPDRLDYARMAMVVDGVFSWLVDAVGDR